MSEEVQGTQEQQPVFAIEKIYVKDASLEIPGAPNIFLEREAPNIEVQLSTGGENVSEGIYDATVKVTVTAKLGERVMFLVEVTQAGVFRVMNIPESEIPAILGMACPNILFPYLRETVSDLTTRAGFPPVLLNPVNFEALYAQQQANAQVGSNGNGTSH
jgi:preprotein translocase subunit SecB